MKEQESMQTKELRDTWLTVKMLAEAEPAFTEPAIRNYIFKSEDRKSTGGIIPGNGLEKHIRRVGRKVLINHQGFLDWIAGGGK